MDPFTIIVAGGLGAVIIALLLIGFFHPKSGAEVLDWKPTRSAETEAQLELDDVAQMIEAQNAMRRRRGLPERTEEEVEEQVRQDQQALDDYAEAFWAEERRRREQREDS